MATYTELGLGAAEEAKVASLMQRLDKWASPESGASNIDRRVVVFGSLLGIPLEREDALREVVAKFSGEVWMGETESIARFVKFVFDQGATAETLADLNESIGLEPRHKTDEKLAKILSKLDVSLDDVDPISLKLSLYVLRNLSEDGVVKPDNLGKIKANFEKRSAYWYASKAGKKPVEVMPMGKSKWDPSPVSADVLDGFISKVLNAGVSR